MARSPLTLAASVTSALPRVGVVRVGILTESAAGRYDAALAELDDGRQVVVRAPAGADAGPELAAEARALRALTPGVRGLLPFRAPELLGEAGLGDARAVVVDFLPGYRVDAAHLPSGRGAATSVGDALASLHALPLSIVRTEGLPVRTPQQVRDDVSRLLDRVEATHAAPVGIVARWRRAVANEELWRFESAVVLGGAGAASFLFEDIDGVPRVTGVLEWHGLSVGDPATDLQWLATAPAAAEDVYGAYTSRSDRAPDRLVRARARLYAELEFAKWLVHGYEAGRGEIVDDAVALLESLAAGVRDEIVPASEGGVDDAIALLDRVPDAPPGAVDTSMHTDAYDPDELALWVPADDDEEEPSAVTSPEADSSADAASTGSGPPHDEVATAPIDISAWTSRRGDAPAPDAPPPSARSNGEAPVEAAHVRDGIVSREGDDEQADADRASDAALRRWLSE